MIMNAKELPELIWTWVNDPTYSHGGWSLNNRLKNTPYVRGDLYDALAKERDEADRRAGAAERGWEQDRDTLITYRRIRDSMKEKRGYHRNVSFDKVWAETCAKADRAEKAEAEVERLRDLVNRSADIFANCAVEDGTCCCGDSMENHPHPLHCGHSPVDHGGYAVDQWMKDYDALQRKRGE